MNVELLETTKGTHEMNESLLLWAAGSDVIAVSASALMISRHCIGHLHVW